VETTSYPVVLLRSGAKGQASKMSLAMWGKSCLFNILILHSSWIFCDINFVLNNPFKYFYFAGSVAHGIDMQEPSMHEDLGQSQVTAKKMSSYFDC
jgi:hypothetical protein